MWQTVGFFERFQYFNFETDFLEYNLLIENTKIENSSLQYKTAILKTNVKTNKMLSTKWIYHKERNFASSYFIFLKILFQFENLL